MECKICLQELLDQLKNNTYKINLKKNIFKANLKTLAINNHLINLKVFIILCLICKNNKLLSLKN